MSEILGLDHK